MRTAGDVSSVPAMTGLMGLVDAAFVHHFRMTPATFEKLVQVLLLIVMECWRISSSS